VDDDSAASTGRHTVRVPASSANLGPGYDSFGLALGLYDTFRAEAADAWTVEVRGEGAGTLRTDAGNKVAEACIAALTAAGAPDRAAHLVCDNGVPTGRGLGSSSAAIVGGVMLGFMLAKVEPTRDRVFELAARIEGHPDNVAAAANGGFTVCWQESDGPACAALQPAGGVAAVVVVSDAKLRTVDARGLLPESVPHADAAFTASRAGLTVAGLLLGRAELVRVGLEDRIHQPYRVAAVPDLEDVRAALLAAGADGAALSGAGPTVVGIVTAGDDAAAFERARQVAAAATEPVGRLSGRREPFALPIDRAGAVVL
jgi:homoserine kinase